MSDHHDEQDGSKDQREQEGGGTLSEGGSAAQNRETSVGGADSVPDTPDVNTEISDDVQSTVPREGA